MFETFLSYHRITFSGVIKILLMRIVGLVTFIVAAIVAINMDDKNTSLVLEGLAQICITMSIGIGAISLAIKNDRKVFQLLKEVILIMLFSVLSYLLSFLPHSELLMIKKIYLAMSCLVLILILLNTAKFITNHYDKIKND